MVKQYACNVVKYHSNSKWANILRLEYAKVKFSFNAMYGRSLFRIGRRNKDC